jgi:hypothetical protein
MATKAVTVESKPKMKYDGLWKSDTVNGRIALKRLSLLKVGSSFEEPLMPSLPIKVLWTCTEVGADSWKLEGTFCGIPFYSVDVTATESSVAVKAKELGGREL